MNEVKDFLNKIFTTKNFRQLKFFLELEIIPSSKGIQVFKKNIKQMFKQDTYTAQSYCKTVERLLYLTNTKPNINFITV